MKVPKYQNLETTLTRRVPIVKEELFTLPEHPSSPAVFSGVCATRSSFMCMFCRSLFVLLYFFFCPLCCLSFDVRILISSISSKSSSNDYCMNNVIKFISYMVAVSFIGGVSGENR